MKPVWYPIVYPKYNVKLREINPSIYNVNKRPRIKESKVRYKSKFIKTITESVIEEHLKTQQLHRSQRLRKSDKVAIAQNWKEK